VRGLYHPATSVDISGYRHRTAAFRVHHVEFETTAPATPRRDLRAVRLPCRVDEPRRLLTRHSHQRGAIGTDGADVVRAATARTAERDPRLVGRPAARRPCRKRDEIRAVGLAHADLAR